MSRREQDQAMTIDGHALTRLRDALLADPYPVYRQFRENDPVHWSEAWNAWFLTGYDDVATALKEPRLRVGRVSDFTLRKPASSPYDMTRLEDTLASWLLFQDPPSHDRLRSLVSKAFTPQTLRRTEEAVRHRVDRLLACVPPETTEIDLIAVLASPLPVLTVADMLAGASDAHDTFHGWSHDLATFLGDDTLTDEVARRAENAVVALEKYFRTTIAERREQPKGDLVSDMLEVREDGVALKDEEIIAMCTLLFAAGHDTTTNLIANGLLAFLQHDEAKRTLLQDPPSITSAVEEVLRFDSPSQVVSRYAAEDVELGGRTIQAGQIVNLCVGAANRDPAQFPEPDRFDVLRSPNRHVAFGKGIHTCLGAFLARQEARIAIAAVFERWPHVTLSEVPRHWPTLGFRRLKSLRVRLSAPPAIRPRTVVRLARADDIPFVRELAVQSIVFGIPPGRDATPEDVRPRVAQAYEKLEQTFNASRDFVILIAERMDDVDGGRIGYIMLDFAQTEAATGERQCFIVDLAVERGRWGKGTTHSLIEKAAQLTRSRGLKYLVGHVSANNVRTLGIAQDALGFTIERHQIMKRCD